MYVYFCFRFLLSIFFTFVVESCPRFLCTFFCVAAFGNRISVAIEREFDICGRLTFLICIFHICSGLSNFLYKILIFSLIISLVNLFMCVHLMVNLFLLIISKNNQHTLNHFHLLATWIWLFFVFIPLIAHNCLTADNFQIVWFLRMQSDQSSEHERVILKKGRKHKRAATNNHSNASWEQSKGERNREKQHRNRKLNQDRNGRWFNKLQCVFRAPLLIQFLKVKRSFYYWINQSQPHRFIFGAVQIKNDWVEAEKISAKIMHLWKIFVCLVTGRNKRPMKILRFISSIYPTM